MRGRVVHAVGPGHPAYLAPRAERAIREADVARDNLDHGCERSDVAPVCERRTRDDESITRTTVGELARHADGTERADTPFSDLSVLVVRR